MGTANKGSFSADPSTGRKPLGRPVGSFSKQTVTLRSAIMKCFHELQDDPEHNMLSWATREPTEFYKLASKLLPTEIVATVKESITVRLLEEDEGLPAIDDSEYVEFDDVNVDDDIE